VAGSFTLSLFIATPGDAGNERERRQWKAEARRRKRRLSLPARRLNLLLLTAQEVLRIGDPDKAVPNMDRA
jgi:hypothetical protein